MANGAVFGLIAILAQTRWKPQLMTLILQLFGCADFPTGTGSRVWYPLDIVVFIVGIGCRSHSTPGIKQKKFLDYRRSVDYAKFPR